MIGPNVKKLIIWKMSRDAIPPGGGFVDGIRFLSNPKEIVKIAKAAEEWVKTAILAVKQARDNSYGNDDEAIAGEIIRRIELRRKNG